MEKNQDSKLARIHLRSILKEMGKEIDPSLQINSWELLDLILKNIHLVNIELKNLRKANRQLQRKLDESGQYVLAAIAKFYEKSGR